MDAVELPFPVDLAPAPKLMGSEDFVRAGVTVKEVEARGSDHVSIIVSHSIECCNSRLIEKGKVVIPDIANMKNDTEFHSRDEFPETAFCKNSSLVSDYQSEEVSKNVYAKGKNCPVITSRLEGKPLQHKEGKVNRSNSSCFKRPRTTLSEDFTSQKGIEGSKDISDKLRSNNIKCSSEKSQLPKQKSNASKRGDKRNFKIPAKAKFDSSSMKMGASIFSSPCGGNNFFGLYGLKHDIHDVTKLTDELTLDEILRGTFDCPSLAKDKGKKTSNMSESFLNTVRKACSIIHFPKTVQSQNMAEMDGFSNQKMSACELSSVCVVESGDNGDKGESCSTDMSSCQKDLCSETETPASLLDFRLYQPKDILERIALPPSRDLESLLLDASKPIVTSRSSNDLRTGKQVPRWPSLPPFPWSHALGGHCRTNSDAVKLSSRSTCQGRWARIGFIATLMVDHGCFTNLDSFSYDQSLVPSMGSSDNKISPSLCASLPFSHWDSSSPVTCSKGSQATADFGVPVDYKKYDGHCPRLLAAAQTLYEMTTHLPRQNAKVTLGWQKKTSHKTMKARNLKSNEKLEETLSRPVSVIGSELLTKSVEQIIPSKKRRLSIIKNKDGGHYNTVKKGPCAWPTSKSSRSLTSKSVREPIVENKHSSGSILKQHFMMPPPVTRVLDKAYESQPKVKKLVLMDWKRGRDKSG